MTTLTEVLLELFQLRQADCFFREPVKRPDGRLFFRYCGMVLFYALFLVAFSSLLFYKAFWDDQKDGMSVAALCIAPAFFLLGAVLLSSALFYRVAADENGIAQRSPPGFVRGLPWGEITGAQVRHGALYLCGDPRCPTARAVILSGRLSGIRALSLLLQAHLRGQALETAQRWARDLNPEDAHGAGL